MIAVAAIILSALGMVRSIRTGGRKYVAGIVFSGVGIATGSSALMMLLTEVVLKQLI